MPKQELFDEIRNYIRKTDSELPTHRSMPTVLIQEAAKAIEMLYMIVDVSNESQHDDDKPCDHESLLIQEATELLYPLKDYCVNYMVTITKTIKARTRDEAMDTMSESLDKALESQGLVFTEIRDTGNDPLTAYEGECHW